MWWKIKRWWLFRLAPCPKIGDRMVFYPFKSNDYLRQELVIQGIRGNYIFVSYVDCEETDTIHYEVLFECYINKKFLESWGIKL